MTDNKANMFYTPISKEIFENAIERYKGIIRISKSGTLKYEHTNEIIGKPIYNYQPKFTNPDNYQSKIPDNAKVVTFLNNPNISLSFDIPVSFLVSPTTMVFIGSYHCRTKEFYPEMPLLLPVNTQYKPFVINHKAKDGWYKFSSDKYRYTYQFINGCLNGMMTILPLTRNGHRSEILWRNGFPVENTDFSVTGRIISSKIYTDRCNVKISKMPTLTNNVTANIDHLNTGTVLRKNARDSLLLEYKESKLDGKFSHDTKDLPEIIKGNFKVLPPRIIVNGYLKSDKVERLFGLRQNISIRKFAGTLEFNSSDGRLVLKHNYDWSNERHGLQEDYYYDNVEIKYKGEKSLYQSIDEDNRFKVHSWYWCGKQLSKDDYNKEISTRSDLLLERLSVKVLVTLVMDYLT